MPRRTARVRSTTLPTKRSGPVVMQRQPCPMCPLSERPQELLSVLNECIAGPQPESQGLSTPSPITFEPFDQWSITEYAEASTNGIDARSLQCLCTNELKNYAVVRHEPSGREFIVGLTCIKRFFGEAHYKTAEALQRQHRRRTCGMDGCEEKIDRRRKSGKRGLCEGHYHAQVVAARVYLCVTFDDKHRAKALGARFDAHRKQWYAADETAYLQHFVPAGFFRPLYIRVPFHQKDEAKDAGARWDKRRRLWYAQGEDHYQQDLSAYPRAE